MARAGSRNRPAAYPKFPFHVVRFCQMLASLIVAGEMFYFVWQIKHGGHRVPWMFFFLHGAALLTIITLVLTAVLYCCHKLSALANGAINLLASALWIAGFGLLADAMNETILDACTPALWGSDTGIKICRLYKLLFVASLLGVLSTIGAFILDMVVYMRVRPAAKYSQANPLLGNNTAYQAGYEGPYDPHAKSTPQMGNSASAFALPVFETYTHGRKGSQHGA